MADEKVTYWIQNLFIEPNYADNPNYIDQYSSGTATYTSYEEQYRIDNNYYREWTFSIHTFVCTSPDAYNIYARCNKYYNDCTTYYTTGTMPMEFADGVHKDYYFFPIGQLSAITNGKRTVELWRGANAAMTRVDNTDLILKVLHVDTSHDTSGNLTDRKSVV